MGRTRKGPGSHRGQVAEEGSTQPLRLWRRPCLNQLGRTASFNGPENELSLNRSERSFPAGGLHSSHLSLPAYLPLRACLRAPGPDRAPPPRYSNTSLPSAFSKSDPLLSQLPAPGPLTRFQCTTRSHTKENTGISRQRQEGPTTPPVSTQPPAAPHVSQSAPPHSSQASPPDRPSSPGLQPLFQKLFTAYSKYGQVYTTGVGGMGRRGSRRERGQGKGGEGGRTRSGGRHAKHLLSATAFHAPGPRGAHPNTTFPLGHGSGGHAPGNPRQAHGEVEGAQAPGCRTRPSPVRLPRQALRAEARPGPYLAD